MDKRLLLMGLIAPAFMVGCQNDLTEGMNNAAGGDNMMSTKDLNFVVTRGTDADTKALWDRIEDGQNVTYQFKWEAETGDALDAVGLAYVGSATGAQGVTNYKFDVDSLQLADFAVKSGNTTHITGFYQIGKSLSDVQTYYTKANGTDLTQDDLGTSLSAKFKTVNDYIMRGYYVGYYPFDASYEDPGAIPVKGGKRMEIEYNASNNSNALLEKANLKVAGENSYAYTTPTQLEPGAQVTYLPMQQLTGLIRLNVNAAANYGDNTDPNKDDYIKTVILRTQGNDLFTVGGTLKSPAAAPAASNINVTETVGVLTVAYPYNGSNQNQNMILDENDGSNEFNAYFPVLPVTLNGGIDVILINKEGWACVLDYEFANGSTNIESGKAYTLSVTVDKNTKFDHRFVTSQAELQEAIDDAKQAAAHTTIELLGDVETDGLNVDDITAWRNGVTITGAAGSKLVLKDADFALHNATQAENWNAVFNIDVTTEIEGGTFEGTVNLDGETTFKGDVKVGHATSDSDFYPGLLNINADATIEKDAKLDAVYSYGITIAEGATLTVAEGAEFINNNWKFGTGNAQYKSDLIIEGELIVDGTLTDMGDTQINGGTLTINGEATNQNNLTGTDAAIVVNGTWRNQAGDATAANKLINNGYVNILSGTIDIAEEGNIYNEAELNCAGTFVNDGTFYDYVGSVYGGVPYTSNGTYAAYVNSEERLTEAYVRLNRYAAGKDQTIILQEVGTGTPATSYDLTDKRAKTVDFQNEGDITLSTTVRDGIMKIKSLTVNSGTVTLDSDLMINSDEAVTIKGAQNASATLTIENDIEVSANGKITNSEYGVFNLKRAESTTNLPATVYCKSVNATVGTWNNLPLIIADGSFWDATEGAK